MDNLENNFHYLSQAVPHMLGTVMVRGEGAYLWDNTGRRYMDFSSGVGVTNTGYCHPRVVEAIRDQAGKLMHLQMNIAYHEPMLRLLKVLSKVTPPGLDTFFFANSGAEAVEAGIKLARQATGRTNIISFQWGFHGRTIGTMSLTASKTHFRSGYQPLMAGVFIAPYAYCFRCPLSEANPDLYHFDSTCEWPLEQIRFMFKSQTAPEETAAIILEPVLGEGGYVVPPVRFIKGLRQICDEHGIMLIADEIQSGFGRTGRFFAIENFDVVPDILIMSKGLASGLPLSGIATRRELMSKANSSSHGGTYGGNAVACASAEATINVLVEEKLVENAARLGKQLLSRMKSLQGESPSIGDTRGLGLMVGVEFVEPGSRKPNKKLADAVQSLCIKSGLILLTCGTYGNVIRWIPPLVINEAQLDEAIDIFERAVMANA